MHPFDWNDEARAELEHTFPQTKVSNHPTALLSNVGIAMMLLACVGCQYSASSLNTRGVSLFQTGQSQQAVAEFQSAIAANPRDADAYYNLAATYHYLGRQQSNDEMLRQAENLYHQCLDLHPNHVACHRAMAVMLVDTDRPKSAFTLLERWADRAPGYAEPRIELARLHEEFGELSVARRYLTEAIDSDPRSARAWTALGRLREQDGQLAQALNNYEQAYRLNSYQPGVANRISALQQRIASNSRPLTSGGSRTSQTSPDWRQR